MTPKPNMEMPYCFLVVGAIDPAIDLAIAFQIVPTTKLSQPSRLLRILIRRCEHPTTMTSDYDIF